MNAADAEDSSIVAAADCPDLASLQALVEGELAADKQTEVTRHLEGCVPCQDKLERLAASDVGWEVAARHLQHENAPAEPIPGRVFDEEVTGAAGAAAERTTEMPLDFLDPVQKEGVLGRLAHYDVLEIIGRGGMGIVLKAVDQSLQRVVAVKVMAPQLATSLTARKRFIREAQAAAAIRDDHVVGIHAVDEEKGLPYLVMEYIAGVSLQARIERTGPLRLEEILRIGAQTAAGLAAAHAQGLIHRDIKPANILLENHVERVKITDFGLARAADDASLTLSGVVAGTPHYMSPEQARGERVDHRTDLFSLGSVLYAMCTGVVPFRASGSLAVLKRVCEDPPRLIEEINPAIPAWLTGIIGRLHAKIPADRLQTAAEVGQLLKQHLAHLQQPATAPAPPSLSKAAGPVSLCRPRLRRLLIAFCVVAAAFLLAGYRYDPTIYLFAKGQARLEFATDDTHIEVMIRRDQKPILTIDLHKQRSVDLDAGDYDLELIDGRADMRLSTEKITLSRGGTPSVEIREVPDFVGEIRRFVGHTGDARSVAFSPDGSRALSSGADSSIRLWDVASGKELRVFLGHNFSVNRAVFSPDVRHVLSCAQDGTIRFWDLRNGKQVQFLSGHADEICSVAISPDGMQAVSGCGINDRDGNMRLWDLANGKEVLRFQGHTDFVWSVAISKDGRHALSGSWDRSARLWDMKTGQELKRFEGHSDFVLAARFAPDGRHIFTAGRDKTIRLWEIDSGEEVRGFEGHQENVESLAISPDGSRILSGGHDGTLRLWDVDSGRELHRFTPGVVISIAFSPDGRRALTAGSGGDSAVRLWRLPASTP